MNRFAKFFHELINPHCPHCREEHEENKVCSKCEVLQHQLEIANIEKQKLLDSILQKPEETIKVETPTVPKPRFVPWETRRQILEAEDRKAAQLKREATKQAETVVAPADDPDVVELEKELKIVEEAREAENASQIRKAI